MQIKKLTPLINIRTLVEIDDGTQQEIFALVNIASSIVLVPDDQQFFLIEDRFEEFAKLLLADLSQSVKVDESKFPRIPESVMSQIQAVRLDAEKKQQQARADIEFKNQQNEDEGVS